jgi:2-isopropylmalate synthase
MIHDPKLPFVGEQAFSHKGGIHVSALQKDTITYEHISPAVVGNKRQVLISELSGRGNIEYKAKELGMELTPQLAKSILNKIKKLEEQGYQFEGADASFELVLRNESGDYNPFFKIENLRVLTDISETQSFLCEATIIVDVNGETEHTAAMGCGPVEALDKAIRKALVKFYPILNELQLCDYKVRVLNSKEGTGAQVRVLIDQKAGDMYWTTVGVSANVIEASWLALTDGIEYLLYKNQKKSE